MVQVSIPEGLARSSSPESSSWHQNPTLYHGGHNHRVFRKRLNRKRNMIWIPVRNLCRRVRPGAAVSITYIKDAIHLRQRVKMSVSTGSIFLNSTDYRASNNNIAYSPRSTAIQNAHFMGCTASKTIPPVPKRYAALPHKTRNRLCAASSILLDGYSAYHVRVQRAIVRVLPCTNVSRWYAVFYVWPKITCVKQCS